MLALLWLAGWVSLAGLLFASAVWLQNGPAGLLSLSLFREQRFGNKRAAVAAAASSVLQPKKYSCTAAKKNSKREPDCRLFPLTFLVFC